MGQRVEIERKFLIRQMPDLSDFVPTHYERHLLFHDNGVELRVQLKGAAFQLERKVGSTRLSRDTTKWEISEEEFELLKSLSLGSLIRDGYNLSENPSISIKIYRGAFEGLVRAEVEFGSEEEARAFVPPNWMGTEITDSLLGRDSELVILPPETFATLLRETSTDGV